MTPSIQVPDFVVGHIGNHCRRFRMFAEEAIAHVLAVHGLDLLVLAIHGLLHDLAQLARLILREQWVPIRAPDNLNHIPACAAEGCLEFLDDLAIATHRPIETLQVAINDEDQIIQTLSYRHCNRAHRLRLIHLAVAKERPDLAITFRKQAAIFHVAHEARLIDRHHRSQSHRHGRELPEIRHQPGMGIR